MLRIMSLIKLLITGLVLSGIGIFYGPLYDLALISIRDPLYSHVLLIPLVSLYIFWTARKSIFSEVDSSAFAGIVLLSIGLMGVFIQKYQFPNLSPNDALSLSISCMIFWIFGGYLLVCGRRSFKKALFPLLFLLFLIPFPSLLLDSVVSVLQVGSVWSTMTILRALNVPAYVEGVFISLPGVTIEVAKECSGIRSGVALMILCIVAGHLYLKSNRRRVIFILSAIPITIFKNGMRIATLSILGTYVDIHYLTNSALHSFGGKPFFLVAILMMAPIFWMLKHSEIKAEKNASLAKIKQPLNRKMGISKDVQII